MRAKALLLLFAVAGLAQTASASSDSILPAYKPTPAELAANYKRAAEYVQNTQRRMYTLSLSPNWLEEGKRFWYVADRKGGVREFIMVDSATGAKTPAFDHTKLAAALSKELGREVRPTALPFNTFELRNGQIYFETGNAAFIFNDATGVLTKTDPPERRRPPARPPWRQNLNPADTRPQRSPDGKWTAQIVGHNVVLRPTDGQDVPVTDSGSENAYFARLSWSPDSKHVVATRVMPGDRHLVHMIESSPREGGRAKLHSRVYDLPGDKVDTYDHWVIAVDDKKARQVGEVVDYGSVPFIRWQSNGTYLFDRVDRGYGRWRVFEVNPSSGTVRTVVDDDPETFFDTTAQYTYYARTKPEIIWRSERTGWGHLYLTEIATGKTTPVTSGDWVVRGVDHVDEDKRQIWFRASGREAVSDPYYIHYYRVNFDGTGLTKLTDGDGNHEATFSPDRSVLMDTWSRVDMAPVHELRRTSDGSLIKRIDTADISELVASGWKAPERFVAKGRDGKTDIYGIVCTPQNFDTGKAYPVIEDIYAGPQDSFVPKSFRGYLSLQALAELGFVVVKVDGMGTRNRSKAFHDYTYKNRADSGFPDRIAWMRSLAAKYPYVDVSKVGIYGTSAGGQESTAGVLFHPDFYKVAVSACGCHDNRMDKVWWNEQWMGPMGEHYAEQSNITNAGKLKGKLLLIVGELDDNVPPESTYRLVDALIKANKDFDLLVIPGAGHTSGGSYGERRKRDFFVRNLLGVEPPDRNKE